MTHLATTPIETTPKHSYAQALIYKDGGSYIVLGKTRQECLVKTRLISIRLTDKLLAATIPYIAVRDKDNWLNASIPSTWKSDLGEEFMRFVVGTNHDILKKLSDNRTNTTVILPEYANIFRNSVVLAVVALIVSVLSGLFLSISLLTGNNTLMVFFDTFITSGWILALAALATAAWEVSHY